MHGYVQRAHELDCRFLYSLNRERSSYNRELDSVSAAISPATTGRVRSPCCRCRYQKMMGDEPSQIDYKHIIGWRRVKV